MALGAKEVMSILNGKIDGVAQGVKSVKIDPTDNSKILFELQDNSTISLQIPNPINDPDLINKITINANGKVCYDGVAIDTDTKVDTVTFNQTSKELKLTLTDSQEFTVNIPTGEITEAQQEALTHLSGSETTVGQVTEQVIVLGALRLVETTDSATGDVENSLSIAGKNILTEEDIDTSTNDDIDNFFNSITI